MKRMLSQCTIDVLSLLSLSLLVPLPASASLVFDDDFEGDSGGMPAGWLLGHGSEIDVVEAGSIATLSDWVSIHSDATVDPSSGTVTMLVQVAGTNPDGKPHAGYANHATFCRCGFLLWADTGEVQLLAADTEGGSQVYTVGLVEGYAAGPIQVTLIMEETAFRVLTDAPPLDSGLIDYATAFSTFTHDDLGQDVHLYLMNDVDPLESGISAFDRITIDVEPPTTVEGTTLGRIKALFRH